ncbi:hypothetical protein H6P81_007365 [Aristolochia fimbriata]|uniref:Replication factor C subunit 3 n=1 Tax=Aristolochia fimbriata TaxID=158543 RepID=A0AAV7F171_ARIFI|nr:hypothetical protein H6P81_007365 [Aristolochia fimbriata]
MARPNLQIRSLSPNIPKPTKEPSPTQLRPRPPRSSRSSRSNYSTSSSFSRKLLLIKAKIGRINAGSAHQEHSNLTEVSLEEHNRIQAAAESEIRRHWGTSPYYKGLTDSALYLNRVRNGAGLSSPGRESRATTARSTSSSSISSVFSKIHEWGATCFKGKPGSALPSKLESSSSYAASRVAITSSAPAPPTVAPTMAPPPPRNINSRVSVSAIQDVIEIESMRGQFVRPVERPIIEGKPLRERVVVFPVVKMEATEREQRKEEMKENEFVWADRYRPNTLNDFICNRDRATYLRNIVAQAKCSHLIFEGPPGVGKRTMIWALLKEIYGAESLRTKEVWKEFQLKGEAMANIKVRMKVSALHVEINLSELRGYERQVIVDLVKQNADNSTDDQCDPSSNCRIIVLHDSDKLSTDAQHYIRWVMERYQSCNKIIFCCSDVTKLHPVRSLCEYIQLLPPSNNEIVEVLEFIAKQEGIELPHHLAEKIADNSKQNLRQAIRSFEASWQMNLDFVQTGRILTGWEDDIANIAKNIIDEQSPKQLYIIRGKLQKLIEHSVSPEFIFSTLVEELKKHLDEKFKPRIDALYMEYNRDGGFPLDGESSVVLIRRPEEAPAARRNSDPVKKNIYHFMKIEEFTAKFMSFYKSCVKKNSEGDGGEPFLFRRPVRIAGELRGGDAVPPQKDFLRLRHRPRHREFGPGAVHGRTLHGRPLHDLEDDVAGGGGGGGWGGGGRGGFRPPVAIRRRGGVLGRFGGGVELEAADGAGGVVVEPEVDAILVEDVVAAGDEAEDVAVGELPEADGALPPVPRSLGVVLGVREGGEGGDESRVETAPGRAGGIPGSGSGPAVLVSGAPPRGEHPAEELDDVVAEVNPEEADEEGDDDDEGWEKRSRVTNTVLRHPHGHGGGRSEKKRGREGSGRCGGGDGFNGQTRDLDRACSLYASDHFQ